jgi:hypothetical protein
VVSDLSESITGTAAMHAGQVGSLRDHRTHQQAAVHGVVWSIFGTWCRGSSHSRNSSPLGEGERFWAEGEQTTLVLTAHDVYENGVAHLCYGPA